VNGLVMQTCTRKCNAEHSNSLANRQRTIILEIGRYISLADISPNILILPIYRYRPKQPILLASVGVDKTLLYSSRIQTTCARKHNEESQDSYLTATLAGAVS